MRYHSFSHINQFIALVRANLLVYAALMAIMTLGTSSVFAVSTIPSGQNNVEVPSLMSGADISSPSTAVQGLVDQGKVLFRKSDFSGAKLLFSKLLELEPESSEGYYWLGQIFIKTGMTEQGMIYIERAAELSPENSKLLQALGQALGRQGDTEQAISIYLKAIAVDAENMAVRVLLAALYAKNEQINLSLDLYEKVIVLKGQSPEAVFSFARYKKLYPQWLADETVWLAENKTLNVDHAIKLVKRGRWLSNYGLLDQAVSVYKLVVQFSPENSEGHYWFSQVLLKLKRMNQAIVHIQKSVELMPENLLLKEHLGKAYQDVNDEVRAETIYIQILEQDPNYRDAIKLKREISHIRGRRFESEGDIDMALKEYLNLAEKIPDDSEVLELVASMYELKGNTNSADLYFSEALMLNPKNIKLRKHLVMVYAGRGDKRAEHRELVSLLAIVPTGLDKLFALNRLGLSKGIAHIDAGQYKDALVVLNKLSKIAPNEILVQLNIGVVYQKQENFKAAETAFLKASKIEPLAIEPYMRLGKVYLSMDRFDDAVMKYEKVAAMGRDFKQGQEANRILDKLEKLIISMGRSKLERGELLEAENIFQRMVKRDPDNAQGHYWLGKVLIKQKKISGGLSGLERSVELAPDIRLSHQVLAETYESAGKYEKARQSFQNAYDLAPDESGLLLKITEMYQLQGDNESFYAALRRYLDLSIVADQRDSAIVDLGLLTGIEKQLEDGEYKKAIDGIKILLKTLGEEPVIMSLLAIAYHKQGLRIEAVQVYRNLLIIRPNDFTMQLKLGLLYRDMGQLDNAIKALRESERSVDSGVGEESVAELNLLFDAKIRGLLELLKTPPPYLDDVVERVINESHVLVQQKAYVQVLEVLIIAVEKIRHSAPLNFLLSKAHMGLGNESEGVKALERSFSLAPEDVDVAIALGINYENNGRSDDAVIIYTETLLKQPDSARLHLRLALLFKGKGDGDMVRKHVKIGYKTSVDERIKEEALNIIGLADAIRHVQKKEYAEAEVIFEDIFTLIPDDKKVIKYSGMVKVALEKVDEAAYFFRRLMEEAPKDYTGYKLLAEIYAEGGREVDAIKIYEAAQKNSQSGVIYRDIVKALYDLHEVVGRNFLTEVGDLPFTSSALVVSGIKKGHSLFKIKKYNLAGDVLRRVVQEAPNEVEANYWLGRVYMESSRMDEGLVLLKRSVKMAPDNKRLVWDLAKAYERAGKLEEAVSYYVKIYDHFQGAKIQMIFAQALLDRQQGKYQQAIIKYKRLLLEYPNDIIVQLLLVQGYQEAGNTAAVELQLSAVLSAHPKDVSLRKKLVVVYKKRGDIDSVNVHLRAILDLATTGSKDYRYALNQLGLKQGQKFFDDEEYEKALIEFNRVLDVAPGEVLVLLNMAKAEHRRGDMSAAESYYREIISVNPEVAETYLGLGDVFLNQKKYTQAIIQYEKVITIAGSKGSIGRMAEVKLSALYTGKAKFLISKGSVDEAIDEYKKLIERTPDNISALSRLAALYGQRKEYVLGQDLLERVIVLDDQNMYARRILSLFYEKTKNYEKALESRSYVIALTEDVVEARKLANKLSIVLARKLFMENNLLQAFREFERVRVDAPDMADASYYLGILYGRVGNIDLSIAAYENVLRLRPDNYRVRFTLAILYERKNEDELALDQYQKIIREADSGLILERSRKRIEAVKSRSDFFTSSMNHRVSSSSFKVGDNASNSLSSVMSLNMDLAYKPRKSIVLKAVIGGSYTSNHVSQSDALTSRMGGSGTVNFENGSIGGNFTLSENSSLLLEDASGSSVNFSVNGVLRFTGLRHVLEMLRREDKYIRQEQGVTEIVLGQDYTSDKKERVDRKEIDLSENKALRDVLEALQASIDSDGSGGINVDDQRYVVKRGDTLWNIAAALLGSPWKWPEIWYANPDIENPHLIYPSDVVTRVVVDGETLFLLQRAGASKIELLSVEEGMKLYQQAIVLIEEERYADALQPLIRVLKFVPGDLLTNLAIAIAYHKLDQYVMAEKHFILVLELDGSHHEARFMMAEMLDEKGDFEAAIVEFERVKMSSLNDLLVRDANEKLLVLYLRSALAMIDRLVSLGADDELVDAIIRRGVQLLQMRAVDSAEEIFDLLLRLQLKYAEVNYWLARIEIEKGHFNAASVYLQLSVNLLPGDVNYREDLASLYEVIGDAGQALVQYQALVKLDLSEERIHWVVRKISMLRAQQYISDGDFDMAVDIYSSLLFLSQDDVSLMMKLADVYVMKASYDLAEVFYLRVLSVSSGHVEAHIRLIEIYKQIDSLDEMALHYQVLSTLQLNGVQRELLRGLLGFDAAITLIRQGMFKEALVSFQYMESMLPGDVLIRLNVALMHQVLGDYDRAEMLINEIIEADPYNITARLQLAGLHVETKKLDEAGVEYRHLSELSSGALVKVQVLQLLDDIRMKKEESFSNLESNEPVAKSLSVSFSYGDFTPVIVSYSDAISYALGVGFSYPGGTYGNWSVNYSFKLNSPEHKWGADYAYISNGLSVSVGRPVLSTFLRGLYGNFSLSRTVSNYTNLDSNALFALGTLQYRLTVLSSLSMSLNYRLHQQLAVSLTYSQASNRSNLPVGFAYSPELGVPVAIHGASMGNYESSSLSLSGRFTF